MSPFGPTEDPLQRKDNYYTSENKIDLTQVLRLLNLQDEGGQKCRVIVSHFQTHYVIVPNDYNNSVNIHFGNKSCQDITDILEHFLLLHGGMLLGTTYLPDINVLVYPLLLHTLMLADPFLQTLSIAYTNYIIEIDERKEGCQR